MNRRPLNSGTGRAWALLFLALVLAGVGLAIPARWRSIDPVVLEAAGRGSARLVDVAVGAARHKQIGVASLLNSAAIQLNLAGTDEVRSALATNAAPENRVLGGSDPLLSVLLPERLEIGATNTVTALDLFLPETHRASFLRGLSDSRSPGVQALLRTRELALGQFAPVGQPGGQALDTAVLMAAALYEQERFSRTLGRELRELAELGPTREPARQSLEEFYLNLLSLARRLNWSALAELTRSVGTLDDFNQFSAAFRAFPAEQSLLYAGALLSGHAGGVARHRSQWGEPGRKGLEMALTHGSGSSVFLARDSRPVRPGAPTVAGLSDLVLRAPWAWTIARSALLLMAAAIGAWSLRTFSRAGIPDDGTPPSSGAVPLVLTAVLIGGFLILASEPLPSRRELKSLPSVRLDLRALTKPSPTAKSSSSQRNLMEPTTLITMAVFGAIQLAVYVICVRKIREISRLPEPPSVRLRLLENEENLFDSGLYVGIGGTAAALIMQVLQLVEANLLAAYSSNLMGILCVAVVKIGHVRHARRRLILESLEVPDAVAEGLPASNPFNAR